MGKSRLGQVWAARQYVRNRPWQRAREARRLREAERETETTDQASGSGEETTNLRRAETDSNSSESSEDWNKEESA